MGLLGDAQPEEIIEETPVPVEDGSIDTTKVSPTETPAVDAAQKPDWLEDKFWNADDATTNVEALNKSYTDLRQAFNDKNNDKAGKSVEDYGTEDFFNSEGMEGMKEDPAMSMAFEAAKEAGLGVKQAQAFITKFMGGMSEFAAPVYDGEAELAKLGKNGAHMVSGIKTWVDGMKNDGVLNDEVHDELLKLGSTAAGIKALDVLRQKSGVLNIPNGDALTGTTHMSADDWYAATYKTHGEAGESEQAFDARMHTVGKTIFGTGSGTFSGEGLGIGGIRR